MQLPETHTTVTVMLKTPVTFPPDTTSEAALPPADRVSFAGFIDTVAPPATAGRIDAVNLTAPEKLFTLVRVKFSRIWLPGEVVMLLHKQSSEALKSGKTVNCRFAVLERVPFEPAMVTVWLPGSVELATEKDRMTETEPPDTMFLATCAGDAVMPGEPFAVIETEPANPLKLVKVTLELAPEIADNLSELGLADIVNPVIDTLLMNVDQHDPKLWQDPVELSWYSPATQTTVGSAGSSAAPK